jgi:hypothetical protein
VGASAETLALLTGYDWRAMSVSSRMRVYRAIVLADAPYLQAYDFPAISGVAAPPPEAVEPVASQRPASLPTAEQLVAEMPADPPVRILDGRGHLRKLEEIERDLIALAIENLCRSHERSGPPARHRALDPLSEWSANRAWKTW